jgi:L-malate glycosyltransferase
VDAVAEMLGIVQPLSSLGGVAPGVFLMTDTLETGGSERQFALLSNALQGRAFRVVLGCLGKRGPFLDRVQPIREFPTGGSFLSLEAQLQRVRLARYLRKNKIQVAHSFDFYSNLMLGPTAKIAGVRVVIASQRQVGDLLTRRQFRVQSAAFRLCDRVVCNSRAAAVRLRETGTPDRKLVIIPNGLPEEYFAKSVPLLPRKSRRSRVGMVARMNSISKNHSLFLRIASRLVGTRDEVDFVLAGDGPLRSSLEQEARELGLGSRVQFLGDCRDVAAVFASLDVSVLTSRSESLSNVILEGMAAGVPAVACDVGGNPELLRNGENGFLVPDGDEHAFTVAVGRLLDDPTLRRAIGERARSEASARFSMPRIRDLYEKLYSDLLTEKAKASRQ